MKNNDSDAFVPKPIKREDCDWNNNVYSESNWNAMETAGAVFLPAAGDRGGSTVYDVGDFGNYWSSTADGGDSNIAWLVGFGSSDVSPVNSAPRYYGCSVRLITESK